MKPSEVIIALKHCIAIGRPAFIAGPVGVGKSEVVAQVAKELNFEFEDVRLNLMDPTDIKGFPVPDVANSCMTWLAPDWLPPMFIKKANKLIPNPSKGLLFLDEMTSAMPATQGAAYQFTLNRAIGKYVLPAGWSIVAAGNRAIDRSITHNMPAALANRLLHIDFETSLDDWVGWAVKNDVSAETIAFLRFKENLLHSFDPSSNPRAFPTPRTWVFADRIVNPGPNHSRLPSNIELELVKGAVGPAGAEYIAFRSLVKSMPDIQQIIAHPDTTPVPTNLSVLWTVTVTLAMRANSGNLTKIFKYIERMPVEFQVVFSRDMLNRDMSLASTTVYTNWAVKNYEVLKA